MRRKQLTVSSSVGKQSIPKGQVRYSYFKEISVIHKNLLLLYITCDILECILLSGCTNTKCSDKPSCISGRPAFKSMGVAEQWIYYDNALKLNNLEIHYKKSLINWLYLCKHFSQLIQLKALRV